jgi:nucleotide-binding universal stress UspA family protein
MYTKIAVAIAFSPTMEALICEAKRLKDLFQSELLLIHIGEKTPELEKNLTNILAKLQIQINTAKETIVWESGKPAKKILQICDREKVDLLVTGALKTEGFFTYYLGSIARKIIRKSHCSVLTLIQPSEKPQSFSQVVINGTQKEQTPFVIEKGLQWCKLENSKKIFVVNEIKMYGMQMATAGEGSENEVANTRRRLVSEEIAYVENILKNVDKGDLKVNIKITCGQWAAELAKFSKHIEADLLIVGDKGNLNFLDRLFPHDLEEILGDLPCNLLILKR